MSIIDTCNSAMAEIDLYKRRQQDYNDAERFRKRTEELAELRAPLEADLRRLQLLAKRGITSKPAKFPPSLVSSVEDLKLNAGSEETGRQNVYAKAKASVSKAAEVARTAVQATISSIETPLGVIDGSFLGRVELDPSLKTLVADTRAKKEEFQRAFQRRLVSPVDLEVFLSRRAELLLLIDQLKNTDLPDEVFAFFRAVRASQATFAHLTPVVQNWLKEHDQLKDVRILMVTK
jgi:hypothetical protein